MTQAAKLDRDDRQRQIYEWCTEAFGVDQAASIQQRGIRFAEEAIEAAQSAGCDMAMIHRLVSHVFSRPPGNLAQEIGGAGIALLGLSEAAKLSAEAEETREARRILSLPSEYWAARNKAKNDAGFNCASPSSVPATPPEPPTR